VKSPGPRVRLQNVSQSFRGESGEVIHALLDVTLGVDPGEWAVLMGPSGSGKTTLLRLIAGLEVPASGTVFVDDQAPSAIPPGNRQLGFVPQAPALFPHRDIRRNLLLGLAFRKVNAAEAASRVDRVSGMLEISDCLNRYPHELSAGQKLRASLGRALVLQPRLLLLDEPFANLDAALRSRLRQRILAFQQETQATVVCVTHDQQEADEMPGRRLILREGRIS
jgi:ABC-type sugar transport system ATPase subunit